MQWDTSGRKDGLKFSTEGLLSLINVHGTVTNQTAKLYAQTVGGILVTRDLAGVRWERDAVFVPHVSGWG